LEVSSGALLATLGGNVGIGTTSPGARLAIQGTGSYGSVNWGTASDMAIRSSEMTDSAYHSILQLVSIRQSLTTGNAANGYLGFSTIDDSNSQGMLDAGRIAIVNEVVSSRNSATALSFWTNPGGVVDTVPATEKVRITSAGNVGIGTTDPGSYKLNVNGDTNIAGALTLSADPTSALHAATKQYVDTATGESGACPTGMAYIPGPYPYCIDKYEAYLAGGTVTNCTCTNGSQAEVDACNSTAVAGSASGQTPLVNINWCAAKKACQLAGKHLLTNSEWFNAANYKGSKWNITAEEATEAMGCNTGSAAANLTGASAGCVTQEGVFDMIGNVWEWVDFVMTADPTNGLANGYVTGYDFATGIPTSVGTSANAYGNDYHWAYNGGGVARAVLRGGRWADGANDGVFAFHAHNVPSSVYDCIGFRCGRRR